MILSVFISKGYRDSFFKVTSGGERKKGYKFITISKANQELMNPYKGRYVITNQYRQDDLIILNIKKLDN